jgi:hypothetical protein
VTERVRYSPSGCHERNRLKRATPAEDFIRQLYRAALLSQGDVAARLECLAQLRAGQLTILLST